MRDKSLPALPRVFRKFLSKAFGGSASNVFKGMATLALGSGIARIIGIAAIPVLTRLYGPEDFGVLAVFSALLSILAPLLTLRYVLAIPLPRHDGTAFNLLMLSACLMLIMTLSISLLLWVFGVKLLAIFSMEELAPWWWLISLGLLASASYEMLTLWATRRRNYRVIARTSVWQSVTGSIVKLGLGLLALKPAGLLIGQVVASGGGVVSLLRGFEGEFRENWRFLRWSRMRTAAWRHRGFPVYRVPSQLFLIMSLQSPILFIAWNYDADIVGQFSLAMMALSLPLSLIGQSMGKAMMAESAKLGKQNAKEIHKIAKQVQKRLFVLGAVPAVLLLVAGEALFSLVFGEEWESAGLFASILSIYLLFQFTSAPLMQLVNVMERQSLLLWLNAFRLFALGLLFYITNWLDVKEYDFAALFSGGNAVFYIFSSFLIMRIVKNEAKAKRVS